MLRAMVVLLLLAAGAARAEDAPADPTDCAAVCAGGMGDRCCILCTVLRNAARGAPQDMSVQREAYRTCLAEKTVLDEMHALRPDCSEVCSEGPRAPCCGVCEAARSGCWQQPISPPECRAKVDALAQCRESASKVATAMNDPKESRRIAILGLSALRCYERGAVATAKETIRQEYAAARRYGGGVVDLDLVHTEQLDAAHSENRARGHEAKLRDLGTKPLRCDLPSVAAVTECFASRFNAGGPCESGDWREVSTWYDRAAAGP